MFRLEELEDDASYRARRLLITEPEIISKLVARLLLGRHKHVAKLLTQGGGPSPRAPRAAVEPTLKLLRNPANAGIRWQRDGWLFQLLTWLVSVAGSGGNRVVSAPHARPADKGDDALFIDFGSSDAALTICEDKATTNPRGTIRDDVLPEFKKYESGARDTELVSKLASMLEGRFGAGAEQVVEDVLWKKKRLYRISIGSSKSVFDGTSVTALFKGYDEVIPGEAARRGADLYELEDLRPWMDLISNMIADELEALIAEESHV